MDERVLTERLISYDTSTLDGLRSAAAFVRGWLGARELDVRDRDHNGLPVILADVGASDGTTIVFHGHLDVVPGHAEQFEPRVEGDRLLGRGAYDMKGGLAAMMIAVTDAARQDQVRVRFICTPDEESEEVDDHSTDVLVREGDIGDFAITGEPTDLHIGIQAKGIIAMKLHVAGMAAHGATPWEGDNAITKAVETFRRIEALPFARESSELFDRPSLNLARINGGDALNKVPDECVMDVDVRYLPGQEPEAILAQVAELPDVEVVRTFRRPPAIVAADNPFVAALRSAVGRAAGDEPLSVGRDGASDAVAFLEMGIPAVEFGPVGGGHHGPEEWVSVSSLRRYRKALGDFVDGLADGLARQEPALRSVEGGLA